MNYGRTSDDERRIEEVSNRAVWREGSQGLITNLRHAIEKLRLTNSCLAYIDGKNEINVNLALRKGKKNEEE